MVTRRRQQMLVLPNDKHQCVYCSKQSYFYCPTCFPVESECEYGICNPAHGKEGGQPCFHKHVMRVKPTHRMQHIAQRLTRDSPGRRQQARTSAAPGAAPAAADGARRRH